MGKRRTSIRHSVLICLICCVLPLNLLMVCFNLYFSKTLLNRMSDTYQTNLDVYSRSLSAYLADTDIFLLYVSLENPSVTTYTGMNSKNDSYHRAYQVMTYMNTYLQSAPYPSVMFVIPGSMERIRYSASKGGASVPGVLYTEYLKKLTELPNEAGLQEWALARIGDRYDLVRLVNKGNFYLGCIVHLDAVLEASGLQQTGFYPYFCDLDGNAIGAAAPSDGELESRQQLLNRVILNHRGYLVTSSRLSRAPLLLCQAISNQIILGDLWPVQRLFVVLGVGSILLLPLAMLYLKYTVLHPLQGLTNAISRIRRGEMENGVSFSDGTAREIAEVYDTFNGMLGEIDALKIKTYEEQLTAQRAQIQYMQLQLKPHFYLNALKSLYSLADHGNVDTLRRLLLSLSNYFRNILYDDMSFVSLADEIQHTKDYIDIYAVGQSAAVECRVNGNPAFMNVQVPALIVQTFVENSIKYARSNGKTLRIEISMERRRGEENDLLLLTVCDNGGGYGERLLAEYDEADAPSSASTHIGICNLRRRLQYIYGEKAYLYLHNRQEGGAVSEILLPYQETGA